MGGKQLVFPLFYYSCVAEHCRPLLQIFKSVPDCSSDSMACRGLQGNLSLVCFYHAPASPQLSFNPSIPYCRPSPEGKHNLYLYMEHSLRETYGGFLLHEKATHSHAAQDGSVGIRALSAHGWLLPCLPLLLALPLAA